jgi:lactoylglutathione lyase
MKVTGYFDHCNLNVTNLEKSIEFYQKALGLIECKRKTASDGSFILVYLTDEKNTFKLELTWLKDHPQPYELGENENHICFRVAEDYEQVHQFHKEMGCVCYENTTMGLYFINDPDGYWLEILKVKK